MLCVVPWKALHFANLFNHANELSAAVHLQLRAQKKALWGFICFPVHQISLAYYQMFPYSRRCCYSLKAPRSVDLSTLLFCCPPMHLSQLGSFGKSIYTGAMVYFLFSFSGLWDPISAKLLGEGGGGCEEEERKRRTPWLLVLSSRTGEGLLKQSAAL